MLASQRGFMNEAMKIAEAAARNAGLKDPAQIQKYMAEAKDEIMNYRRMIEKAGRVDVATGKYIVGFDPKSKKPIYGPRIDSTGFSSEVYDTPFQNMLENLKQKNNPVSRALVWYFEKPMTWYERLDQSFKLGTMIDLVENGIDADEIKMLSRFVPMTKADYTFDATKGMYKLSHDKAQEAVSKIYMNYMAMPAAARVLRMLPFFGAPFASFTYAMTAKAGETALNYPSFFNKVTF
jgi:hypothetical protein